MIKRFLSLIKFSHTLFAMPFALVGYFLGVKDYGFDYVVLIQVILCMVFARSAAMGFNRIVDREWDAKNPRTAVREIPSGQISVRAVSYLVALCCVLFVATTLTINTMCFVLSPVALAVVLGYSYTKRFTRWAHIVLGVGLAFAPIGAYIAVSGSFALVPALFSVLVIGWVAGFDIIFAVQDAEFDTKEGLCSVPSKYGVSRALAISTLLHGISCAVAVVIGFYIAANIIVYWIGAGLFIAILSYEHIVVRPNKLDRINLAFATLNSMASIIFGTFTIVSLFL